MGFQQDDGTNNTLYTDGEWDLKQFPNYYKYEYRLVHNHKNGVRRWHINLDDFKCSECGEEAPIELQGLCIMMRWER